MRVFGGAEKKGVCCLKNDRNEKRSDKNVNAVELAILNGIEAYNREQQAKKSMG